MSDVLNCVGDGTEAGLAKGASCCHSSLSQFMRHPASFTLPEYLPEGSILGENTFAASVLKEELVEFSYHSSPNALPKGVSVNSGPP